MTTESLAARVDAGARMLDEKRPGWHREVAMDELAMENCNQCVLGQIYGHYIYAAMSVLEIDGPEYGFSIRGQEDDRLYLGIADLWRAEIRKRLEYA